VVLLFVNISSICLCLSRSLTHTHLLSFFSLSLLSPSHHTHHTHHTSHITHHTSHITHHTSHITHHTSHITHHTHTHQNNNNTNKTKSDAYKYKTGGLHTTHHTKLTNKSGHTFAREARWRARTQVMCEAEEEADGYMKVNADGVKEYHSRLMVPMAKGMAKRTHYYYFFCAHSHTHHTYITHHTSHITHHTSHNHASHTHTHTSHVVFLRVFFLCCECWFIHIVVIHSIYVIIHFAYVHVMYCLY